MASLVDPRFGATHIPSEKVDALKHRAVLEVETLLADQSRCQLPYLRVPTVPEPADGEAAVAPKAKKTLASFFKQRTATSTAPTKRGYWQWTVKLLAVSKCGDRHWSPQVVEGSWSCLSSSELPGKKASLGTSYKFTLRVFSCSGNIVTCHRASLKPGVVDRLMFLLNEGKHACLSLTVYLKTALLFMKVKKEEFPGFFSGW